ncbi:MAG TPA: hypothetical protein VN969_37890 [Streptosporangiaceae bacterium]|nr:hypothetical protein [Streptosporangiaceae bacterium]
MELGVAGADAGAVGLAGVAGVGAGFFQFGEQGGLRGLDAADFLAVVLGVPG